MIFAPTIFALATPPGLGALAIVRLSGSLALSALLQLSRRTEFAPRYATLAALYDDQQKIDEAIVLYYPAPHSFTGEDCVEITLHGGRATTQGLLLALGKINGLRLAEPGEFTRRAFENGKLDLTQAEAVADLIHAETALQRDQALSQLSGALRDLYQGWAGRVAAMLAHAEADIDFPDEDLPDGLRAALLPQIEQLNVELQNHLSDNQRGERLRDGITLAIVGAPNAGKSTLLNALAQRDVAIVTDIAGTTRDVLEVHLDLGGYPVTLLDTAGLRVTDDVIEAEGIRRARARAEEADFKLCLFDHSAPPDDETLAMVDENSLLVFTKLDAGDWKMDKNIFPASSPLFPISAQTGEGIEALLIEIQKRLGAFFLAPRSTPTLTRARHRAALTEAAGALERAVTASLPELQAEDLRLALRALGRITGHVDIEALLDRIFSEFCIGK